MARSCVALWFVTLLGTMPVAAQTSPAVVSANAVAAGPFTDAAAGAPLTPIRIPAAAARPSVLGSMYVSFAALQGYDAYSTLLAVRQGGAEANPLMAGIVRNPAAFLTVKSATTIATIYVAERLWRQHRRGTAVVLMAVTTGMMAVVAAHNASVLGTQR